MSSGNAITNNGRRGRVLFVGQAYYNAWYLSRELRKLGWKADVLNWDPNEANQVYYHGEDFRFSYHTGPKLLKAFDVLAHFWFFAKSLFAYDIFHFSNANCMSFGPYVQKVAKMLFSEYAEIRLMKWLGKKIVYSHSGCNDGTLPSTFNTFGPEAICDTYCAHNKTYSFCNDEFVRKWSTTRNSLVDFQAMGGGLHYDYNLHPTVHEVPEFYCLDQNFWHPDLLIPANYRLPFPEDTIKIYHSVGNFETRTQAGNKNVKSTHIYLQVIEQLKSEGHKVEMVFFHDVPNKKLRYYQAQADIFADMLTFGYFGASIREGMMLGKPCVCYIRPEWLEKEREKYPEYARELPVISATPDTVYDVLKELILDKEKRLDVGRKSREFAVKWHSAEAGARRFDQIYSQLLEKR